MSQIQNLNPARLRVDYSQADRYLRPDPPKLTFWQKLGRGIGKFVSFAGPIGAAVSAIALPGIGIPIAAGLYGLSRLSQDQVAKAQTKDHMALQAYHQQVPKVSVLPGLFETGPQAPGQAATDFMAPQALEADISQVIIDRDAARFNEISKL